MSRPVSRRSSLLLPVAVPAPYPGHQMTSSSMVTSTVTSPAARVTTPKEDSALMYSSGYASETSSEHESLSELPVDRVEWEGRREEEWSERGASPFGSQTLSGVSSCRYSRSSLLSDVEWKRSIDTRRKSVPATVTRRSCYFTAIHGLPIQSERVGKRKKQDASLIFDFPDDVMRVLESDGHVRYQTDVDTGLRSSQFDLRFAGDDVIQQSRRFSEANAAHDLARYKSRTQRRRTLIADTIAARPLTVGGIASLTLSRGELRPTMSRVNIFKQMDAQNRPAVPVSAPRSPNSIKDALLRWVQSRVAEYPVSVTNFSSSWSDGMAFCALTHRFAPQLFDFASLKPENRKENFDLAFKIAEDIGIPALLETEDMIMMGDRPDWKCVFTYVQQFYKKFREAP